MKYIIAFVSFFTLGLASTLSIASETSPNSTAPAKVLVAIEQGININTADVTELTKLKGIGVKKAEAIIAWRTEHGGFKSVDQLIEVKGIGEATLMLNRENLRI